jgi:hypothetical protein
MSFCGCQSLLTVTFEPVSKLRYIDDCALVACPNIHSFCVPYSVEYRAPYWIDEESGSDVITYQARPRAAPGPTDRTRSRADPGCGCCAVS